MATETWDNPMGTDGFEFIEYAAPDPAAMGALFERMGFMADRAAPAQERHALPPGRDQLHPQRRARLLRAALRPPARPERLRDRLSRAGRGERLRARASRSAPGATTTRPARASSTSRRIKGIGDSLIYLVDRWRGKNGAQHGRHRQHRLLRRRLRAAAGTRAARIRAGHGLDLHRSSHAQRASRPHGRMGDVLRAPVQLPRDPLLRHRGPGHRRQEQGDDEPVRQDPHPDQRGGQREGGPDPGVPRPLSRRRHPAHRDGLERPLQDGRRAARAAA